MSGENHEDSRDRAPGSDFARRRVSYGQQWPPNGLASGGDLDDFEAIVGLDFGRGELSRKERDIVVLDEDRLSGKAEPREAKRRRSREG
jgi:hypothetical protein